MHVPERRVHDGAVADASDEVALGEQLVVGRDDRPPAHAQALGEGTSCWDGFTRRDETAADSRTQLVGELSRQGPRIGAIDNQRQGDIACSPHRAS
jgi:hypothetical protein